MPRTEEIAEADRQESASAAIDDLVVVSNRQPYRHERDDAGAVTVETPAGGLATGIDPVLQRTEGTWIAWGDGDADFDVADDGQVQVPPSDPSYTLERIRLDEQQVSGYYEGYANQGLWPLCHTATGRVQFDTDDWQQYRAVNEQFADAVAGHVEADTTVWFQDYHFTLAPRMVRKTAPEAFLMHFFHIPWPAPDVFRICPQDEAILDGLLGNDLLSFHSPRYCANFLSCVDQLLDGATVDWGTGTVTHRGHSTRVEAIPLGVDATAIRDTATETDASAWAQFLASHDIDADTTVAVGVDRLDYSKGIPQRLAALEHLFETRPDLQGELTYVQKGSPTREGIPAYARYRETIEERIRELNHRFETTDWSPVVYTTEYLDRDVLLSLYRHSDMAIVSPLRDGMNLVAKEFVAAQVDHDGVLLLSPFTGAFEQLREGALEFDPYDSAQAAGAIERAIEMGATECVERMRTLRRTVHDTDLSWWLETMVRTAKDVRESQPTRYAQSP